MPLITQCCREIVEASEATEPKSTTIIAVGSNDYYVNQSPFHQFLFSPSAFHEVPLKSFAKHLIACTIVNWAQDEFTEEDLNTIASSFASHDDVWNQAFLAGKIRHSPYSRNKPVLLLTHASICSHCASSIRERVRQCHS